MSAAHRDEIAKLESLYAENPEGRVFTHLAEAYRKAGELDRAREILSSGIERHPDYSSAHVVLGRVLMDQGEGQEADAAFRRVLDLDPHNLIAMRSRADIARDRGDDAAAMELYNRLLDQEPGDDEVREIVEDMSQPGGAAAQEPVDAFTSESLDEGDADRDDAELRTETIAQVYARQGLYDRAAEVYRELSRARPDDASLRERLAEMEQLARAQRDASDEVDAVSDFDSPSASTEAPWDDAPRDEPPGSEASESESDQPEEESHWTTSAPVEAEDETPWEQTPQPGSETDGLETYASDTYASETYGSETDGSETYAPESDEPESDAPESDEPETADPELGEMPAAGAYHDQWRTAGGEELESEEGHPEAFHVEGLESSEVAASEAEVEQLADIEVDEMDPETGLRTEATPEDAAPEEDLSEEMDVRDVPEPPSERPWEVASGAEDEPSWLSGVGTPETGASVDPEEQAAESVWSGADWAGETDAETTPHAWTEEDDEEVDASPPVRDYFGGLLGWSGPQPGQEEEASSGVPDSYDPPGASEAGGASETGGGSAYGGSEPRDTSAPADRGEDDDDLDMFRSWLESLKQ